MSSADNFPSNEHLNGALKTNPFIDLIEKYYGHYDGSDDALDEIFAKLIEHPSVKKLKDDLSSSPRYTTLYRYDPFSVKSSGDRGGCFGYDQSYGASAASLRIFSELDAERIHTVRTADEVLVIIDQASYLISNGQSPVRDEEPTVLFTSRQLLTLGSTINRSEETEIGALIGHGDSLKKAAPPRDLMSSGMQVSYYDAGRIISRYVDTTE